VLLTQKPVYGSLRAWVLTTPSVEGISYFTARALISVAHKSQSLEHEEYLPLCVLGLVSPQYLKAEPKNSSSEKVALMRANPISGCSHYVTSVTKMCEARCVAGHAVLQGTACHRAPYKEVMCGGTPFQDTANSIEKI